MSTSDDIRPKGTVEVRCSYPGCGIVWWVDPLDPILPNGPFDCGDDHKTTSLIERRLSMLRLRHGISWGSVSPLASEPSTGRCCGLPARAIAIVSDRLRGTKGMLTWETPADLQDTDAVVPRIEWDTKKWSTIARAMSADWLDMHLDTETPMPPGHVRWVGYMVNNKVRRYTFVKCAREGCPHEVMMDVQDPAFRPGSHMVGSWGGGAMPAPPWWGKTSFHCEDGLSTFGTQPCALILSPPVAQFEADSKTRWTIWEEVQSVGNVLFFDSAKNRFGLLTYLDRSPFRSSAKISQSIQWGTLQELAKILPSDSDIMREVHHHMNLLS